jgi:hypothetical protein
MSEAILNLVMFWFLFLESGQLNKDSKLFTAHLALFKLRCPFKQVFLKQGVPTHLCVASFLQYVTKLLRDIIFMQEHANLSLKLVF